MRVQVLARKDNTVLVEWRDQGEVLHRSYLPVSEVSSAVPGGTAQVKNPHEGVEYGFPWSELVKEVCLDGETLEQELYRIGIWTLADAKRDPQKFMSGLLQMSSSTYAELMQKARVFLTRSADNEDVE